MLEMNSVAVLARIRDCHLKQNCDCNCEKCDLDYSNDELVKAINEGIEALLEKKDNG